MADEFDWKLRVSRRVRYAKLQIRPYGGLEIVIPPRFPRREIPRLVEKHAAWIRRQLDKQQRLRDSVRLPEAIHLAFDKSSTEIDYGLRVPGQTRDLFAASNDCLRIDASDDSQCLQQLRAWVRHRARAQLPPLLRQMSARTGLGFNRVSVRSQKTRWGSCSARANISLNDQLLFVPRETVEYLMIHELCHTRHLNHSSSFWQLVAEKCPDYARHEALLSQPRELVPEWFMLDLYS